MNALRLLIFSARGYHLIPRVLCAVSGTEFELGTRASVENNKCDNVVFIAATGTRWIIIKNRKKRNEHRLVLRAICVCFKEKENLRTGSGRWRGGGEGEGEEERKEEKKTQNNTTTFSRAYTRLRALHAQPPSRLGVYRIGGDNEPWIRNPRMYNNNTTTT